MNSEFKSIVERIHAKNHFPESSSLKITRLEAGFAEACMQADESMLNPYGMVHGGALFTLADMAAGACALTSTENVVTLESSINFIRAVKPGPVTARARALHAGHATGVYEVHIFDGDEKLSATALFTMYFFHDSRRIRPVRSRNALSVRPVRSREKARQLSWLLLRSLFCSISRLFRRYSAQKP